MGRDFFKQAHGNILSYQSGKHCDDRGQYGRGTIGGRLAPIFRSVLAKAIKVRRPLVLMPHAREHRVVRCGECNGTREQRMTPHDADPLGETAKEMC
jgi:hypothetical protein